MLRPIARSLATSGDRDSVPAMKIEAPASVDSKRATRSTKSRARALVGAIALSLAFAGAVAAALPPDVVKALETSPYVYISSTRKDGSLSAKAEIWFMYEGGKVYVGTRPESWRVKRIRAGRPQAKIWVGTREGPSFDATGKLVDDPKLQERLYEVFAKKYPGGWKSHEANFKNGFKDGSRVMVEYTPN